MKIDTGNFGNAQREVVNTQINRGNPAEMAEAKISSAQNTARLQGMAAQAWDRVGQQAMQLGGEMLQKQRQLAAQKSALLIQDKQIHYQGAINAAQDAIDRGELKSEEIPGFVEKQMSAFKAEDIDGLDEAGRMQLQRGLNGVDKQLQMSTEHLYRAAHKVESRTTTDAMFSNTERLALNKGGDLSQYTAVYDTPLFRAQAREAYGADFENKIAQAKAGIYSAGAKKDILDNRDSYGGLQNIEKQFEEGGKYYGKVDPDAQLALLGQISTRKGALEAKAIQAQNHADSVANRQLQIAIHADEKMSKRIADGEIPTPEEWDAHNQQTAGTIYANSSKQLQAQMVDTQKLYAIDPRRAQAELDQMKLNLDKNGGTEAEYKRFNALQRNVNQRQSDVRNDPQRVAAMDSGTPLTPFDPQVMLSQPGDGGQVLQTRLANARGLTAKYGAQAGSNLLTKDELANAKAAYKDYTPDQRIQFWRNTTASGGPEVARQLAREIDDNDGAVQSVAALAKTPEGYKTALAVESGLRIINPKDGAAKVKFKSGSDESLIADIKNEYPGISDLKARQLVPTLRAAHVGLGNDAAEDVSTDTIHRVIGTPSKFSGATIVVPPDHDENTFLNKLNDGVAALGPEAASVRNHLNNGTYNFMTDSDGSQVLYNVKTKSKVKAANGQPVVIKVD